MCPCLCVGTCIHTYLQIHTTDELFVCKCESPSAHVFKQQVYGREGARVRACSRVCACACVTCVHIYVHLCTYVCKYLQLRTICIIYIYMYTYTAYLYEYMCICIYV